MTADPYEGFSGHWRLAHEGPPDPERAAFFRRLFEEHGVGRILDCACGTGQDLLLFRDLGLEVHGSDLSEAMLSEAREVLAEAGADIPLARADFRRLADVWDSPFDAVVCLTNSLTHLLEEEEIVAALRSMREALRPGGLLVMDQGQTDRQMRERPRFHLLGSEAGHSQLMVLDYLDPILQVNVIRLSHTGEEEDLEVFPFRFRILLRHDYDRLLSEAGYGSADFHGSWNGEAYDPERSRRLIVVARR